MLKNEREREIINILKADGGFVSVKSMCDALYASESSVRRDLRALEARGLVRRSYGGVEPITNFSDVISFNKRRHHNADAKIRMAKKAVSLVKDGDVIFLDQSSSAFYLAKELMDKSGITVVTNNTEIITLMSGTSIKTVSSGGTLSNENRTCLIGEDAHYIFGRIYADLVFFSTKSLSDDGVISDCSREEVLVRDAMLSNGARKVYLCDSEKFGTRSAYKQCELADVDFLVSESSEAKRFLGVCESLTVL